MASPVYDIRDQKILFCVLYWGLGHASRSTPIIRAIQEHNQVHLASDGAAYDLLRQEFPDLLIHTLPGYNVTYGRSTLAMDIALQLPKIATAYIGEKRTVSQLQKNEGYDMIISDHRYGCRSTTTHNIFIAHQINIMAENTFLSTTATRINTQLINTFDTCWVPDDEDNILSGKLSTPNRLKIPTQYIGVQSRFESEQLPKEYDYAIVLSGPEPARTNLERKLWQLFAAQTDLKAVWVRGTNAPHPYGSVDHIQVHNLLAGPALNLILNQSKTVICRSGYSSIMDLYTLSKEAILIPTPGQTEQEYLAQHLQSNPLFRHVREDEIERIFS